MTNDTIRRARPGWSWTLVGLLQIGNAAAFGAIAATVDFSETNVSTTIPTSAGETDAVADATQSTPTTRANPATQSISEPIAPEAPATDATASLSATTNADDASADEPVTVAVPPNIETAAASPPTVANAAENQLTVRFLVNGELMELQPGERRSLAGGDAWVVRFHRGGDYGAATEILYDGNYEFVVVEQGWSLERNDQSTGDPSAGGNLESSP